MAKGGCEENLLRLDLPARTVPFRREPSSHAHLRVHQDTNAHTNAVHQARAISQIDGPQLAQAAVFCFFSKAALDKHAQNNRISKPGEERRMSLSLSLFSFLLSLLGF